MNKVLRPNKVGRPSRLTEEQKDLVVNHYNHGDTQKEIAMQFGVSVSTIRKALDERR